MEQGNIWFILKIRPYLAVVSIVGGFIGWYLRCKIGKCHGHQSEVVHSHDSDDLSRIKKLQEKLNKAESLNKTLKMDLETSQSKLVDSTVHKKTIEQLAVLQSDLSATTLRANSLEAELKKAKETVGSFHAKANTETKEQRDRTFALENELSKARSEIARLQSGKDDSGELREEMERLRESTGNATRYAGEMRKREAALTDELNASKIALQQAQDKLLFAPVAAKQTSAPPTVAALPVGDSPRVKAAKEEVIRLLAEREATAKADAIRAAAEHAAEVKAAVAEKAAVEVLENAVDDSVSSTEIIQDPLDEDKEIP